MASLLSRGIQPDAVKKIGERWLSHFCPRHDPKAYFEMEYDQAVHALHNSVDYTAKSGFKPDRTSSDYYQQALSLGLDENAINVHTDNVHLISNKVNYCLPGCPPPPPTPFSPQERDVLLALIAMVKVESSKPGASKGVVRFTYEQLSEILRVYGRDHIEGRQLGRQHLPKFVDTEGKPATKVSLLKRRAKGCTGFASEFELTPVMAELLGLPLADPTDTQPEGAPAPSSKGGSPLAREEASGVQAGSEPARRSKAPRKAKERPRKSVEVEAPAPGPRVYTDEELFKLRGKAVLALDDEQYERYRILLAEGLPKKRRA